MKDNLTMFAAIAWACVLIVFLSIPASAASCHGTKAPAPVTNSEPVQVAEPMTHVGVAVDVETPASSGVVTSVLVNGEEVGGPPAVKASGGGDVHGAGVSMGASRRNARKAKRASIGEARAAHIAQRLSGRASEAANEAAVNDRVRRAYEQ